MFNLEMWLQDLKKKDMAENINIFICTRLETIRLAQGIFATSLFLKLIK